jgi:hypothetical protein
VTGTTSHYTTTCTPGSGKSRLNPGEKGYFEYEIVRVTPESEFALYEFVTPDSFCHPDAWANAQPQPRTGQCTTAPITKVVFTQPDDDSGSIRLDNDVIIRVTSMQERLRQIDPENYIISSDATTPAYVYPRPAPGLTNQNQGIHSIQYYKLTLKSVAYTFETRTIGHEGDETTEGQYHQASTFNNPYGRLLSSQRRLFHAHPMAIPNYSDGPASWGCARLHAIETGGGCSHREALLAEAAVDYEVVKRPLPESSLALSRGPFRNLKEALALGDSVPPHWLESTSVVARPREPRRRLA